MKPVEPVILHSSDWRPVTYAKDQPEYLPLPVLRSSAGEVVSCWHMTWRERLTVLFRGRCYLTLLTFNGPLQPSRLTVEPPDLLASEGGAR